MREAVKLALANAMKSTDHPSPRTHDPGDNCHVVDGGMMLGFLGCYIYVQYVQSTYTNCIVIFHDYDNGPTTKG